MITKRHSLFQSFKFAMEGIKIATKYNRNIRIHFIIAIIVAAMFNIRKIKSFRIQLCIVSSTVPAPYINTKFNGKETFLVFIVKYVS